MTHLVTFTAAKAACREMGYTLRKEAPGDSALVLYPLGTGADAPDSYFTACPVDAVKTCAAMATPFDVASAAREGGAYAAFIAEEAAAALSAEEAAAVRAAAMRASVPALRSCIAVLARAAHDAKKVARLRIAEEVVTLKESAIPGTLADSFALSVRAVA